MVCLWLMSFICPVFSEARLVLKCLPTHASWWAFRLCRRVYEDLHILQIKTWPSMQFFSWLFSLFFYLQEKVLLHLSHLYGFNFVWTFKWSWYSVCLTNERSHGSNGHVTTLTFTLLLTSLCIRAMWVSMSPFRVMATPHISQINLGCALSICVCLSSSFSKYLLHWKHL